MTISSLSAYWLRHASASVRTPKLHPRHVSNRSNDHEQRGSSPRIILAMRLRVASIRLRFRQAQVIGDDLIRRNEVVDAIDSNIVDGRHVLGGHNTLACGLG